MSLMCYQRKKSHGVKSGDLGGQGYHQHDQSSDAGVHSSSEHRGSNEGVSCLVGKQSPWNLRLVVEIIITAICLGKLNHSQS